jgi:hypothetical protein
MAEHRSNSGEHPAHKAKKLNWWLIRRVETLVFASMLLAVPYLAVRIMETASTALTVQNTCVDLIRDLLRAKEIARDFNLNITVSSIPANAAEPCSYLIQNGKKTIEQVLLPRGVSIIGSVTFDEKGEAQHPCSFLIAKGSKSVSVEIDSSGQTSMH